MTTTIAKQQQRLVEREREQRPKVSEGACNLFERTAKRSYKLAFAYAIFYL